MNTVNKLLHVGAEACQAAGFIPQGSVILYVAIVAVGCLVAGAAVGYMLCNSKRD